MAACAARPLAQPSISPRFTYLWQADKTAKAALPATRAYAAVADSTIAALVKGDLMGVKKLLSPRMLERLGARPMEASLKDRILPFFADYKRPGKTLDISPTQDIFASPGFAVYRTFIAGDGSEKPFIIYVVSEKNRLVVANILVNKTYQEMNQGRNP